MHTSILVAGSKWTKCAWLLALLQWLKIHVVFSLASEAAPPSRGVSGKCFMYRGCFCSVRWIWRLASNTGRSLKNPATLSLKKLHSYFSFNIKNLEFLSPFSSLLHKSKTKILRITITVTDYVLKYVQWEKNNWFTSWNKDFNWGRNNRRKLFLHPTKHLKRKRDA